MDEDDEELDKATRLDSNRNDAFLNEDEEEDERAPAQGAGFLEDEASDDDADTPAPGLKSQPKGEEAPTGPTRRRKSNAKSTKQKVPFGLGSCVLYMQDKTVYNPRSLTFTKEGLCILLCAFCLGLRIRECLDFLDL